MIGQSQDVQPVSGKVFIKNREGQFVPLTGATQIASGSVIDATQRLAEHPTEVPAERRRCERPQREKHKTEHGNFGGAIFKLTQAKRGWPTLSLSKARSRGPRRSRLQRAQEGRRRQRRRPLEQDAPAPARQRPRQVQTQGKYSAATVRGTKWTVADRCDGTLTHDITDSVAVTDFVRHKTLILHAGQSYLAAARNQVAAGRRSSTEQPRSRSTISGAPVKRVAARAVAVATAKQSAKAIG